MMNGRSEQREKRMIQEGEIGGEGKGRAGKAKSVLVPIKKNKKKQE